MIENEMMVMVPGFGKMKRSAWNLNIYIYIYINFDNSIVFTFSNIKQYVWDTRFLKETCKIY